MKHQGYTLLYIVGLAAMAASLSACMENLTYDHYETVDAGGWERNDTLTFCIPPQKQGDYSLNIGLRTTQRYPYRSLSMILERTVYPSRHTRCDTISVRLTDEDGLPKGKNGISNNEARYRIADFRLKEGDSLCVKLHHCMHGEGLPGLSNIGLELIKK